MKSFYARGMLMFLSVCGFAGYANAQSGSFGTPSLLPTPAVQSPYSPLRPVGHGYHAQRYVQPVSGHGWQDAAPAPDHLPANPLPPASNGGHDSHSIAPAPAPSPAPVVHGAPGCSGCASGSGANGGNGGYIGSGSAGYGNGAACEGYYGAGSGGYVDGGYVDGGMAGGGMAGGGMGGGSMGCWFASAGGLYMNRDDGEDVWLSFDTANLASRTLSSRGARMDWSGGFETHVGRYFNEGRHALEGVYWGVFPNDEEANALGANLPGNLNTTFSFNTLTYDDGLGAGVSAAVDWFDNAVRHRVRRSFEFHNVEVNLLGRPDCFVCGAGVCGAGGYGGGGYGAGGAAGGVQPMLTLGWIAGFRYFKFDENFLFSADDNDAVFTGDPRELHYLIDTENNLFGFQLGANGDLQVTRRLRLFADTKFGIFGNQINHRTAMFGANTVTVVDATSPFNGAQFDVRSSDTDVSFLGEVKLGASFNINCNWRVTGGYRAVAATGIALPTHQIPDNFGDIPGIANVNSDGSLILHGGFGGIEFNY